ncbi:MAG: methyltransferase domain-containing protein [Syntrophotaleaceae bacterium]
MDIRTIDWNKVWQEHLARPFDAQQVKEYWDRRAAGFSRPESQGPYIEQFLQLLSLQPDWRVLDVGCGTGALALPLAARVAGVTALDISAAMLDRLQSICRQQGITNIHPVRASWTDDWQERNITPHEVVIASRSVIVPDLRHAIETLNRFALHRAYISVPAGDGPFDPDLFQAIGRPCRRGADYIYVYNLLYQLGLHASISFISYVEDRSFSDLESATAAAGNKLGNLLPSEKTALQQYVARNYECREGRWQHRSPRTVRWAVMSWDSPGKRF